jgi:hypothetical protein
VWSNECAQRLMDCDWHLRLRVGSPASPTGSTR